MLEKWWILSWSLENNMSITSFGFLLLVTIGVMVYYLFPPKLQWVELLIVSLLFYYYAATPYTIGYLVVSTVIAYASTILISKLRNRTDCKPAVPLAITIAALAVNILIWFVIKNMTVSVETVSDVLKLPSFEMLQERILQLQRVLYLDRVFWQHKESLLFADLSEKIRSDFSVQIGSNACDKRWYEDWINYKLGEESVSTREKLKVRKDFSLENMDDLCDALQYDTDSKTGY